MLAPSINICIVTPNHPPPGNAPSIPINAGIMDYSLAKKENSAKREAMLSQEDLLRPFWFDLPTSFYLRVNKTAAELGISRKELVTSAVDRFIKESKKEKRQIVLPTTPVQKQLLNDFHRRAGALRWKNVSAEERREFMRKMAEARWGSKETDSIAEKQASKGKSRTKR